MAIFGISLNTMLEFQNTDEHLSISTVMCSADVGDIELDFHGGAR